MFSENSLNTIVFTKKSIYELLKAFVNLHIFICAFAQYVLNAFLYLRICTFELLSICETALVQKISSLSEIGQVFGSFEWGLKSREAEFKQLAKVI